MATRQSNMELLRIVSMLMVLAVHIDGASLGLPELMGEINDITARDWWRLSVESLTIIGVNCFVLISGYFGINARMKNFLKLTATCLFYSLGIYIAAVASGNLPFSWEQFGSSFLVYTHTDLWFIPAYLLLFIISPILNIAAEKMPKKQFTACLVTFVLFNLYAGWFWGGKFNPSGYTAMHLFMLYLIGRYIRMYVPQLSRKTTILLYTAFTLSILLQSLYSTTLWTFAYNSPLVLGASVSFFLFFRTLSFNSKAVNTLACSALSVYLIHKHPYVWICIKRLSIYMWDTLSLIQFTAFTIVFILAIYAVCTAVDRIRIFITDRI